jgi:hypothetical protein
MNEAATSIEQSHILRKITPQPSEQSHHLQQIRLLSDTTNHIAKHCRQLQWSTSLLSMLNEALPPQTTFHHLQQ